MIDCIGVCTGDRADVCRAVYGAVRADDYRAFLVYQYCVLVKLRALYQALNKVLSRSLSLRGRPPWTPPSGDCVLYLPHGQSFVEPCIEVRAKLL